MRLRLRLCGVGRLRGMRRVRDGRLQRLLHVGIARVLLLLLLLLFRLVSFAEPPRAPGRGRIDRGKRADGRRDQELVHSFSDGGVLPHWMESRTPLEIVPHAVLRAL
jgi:hypothetical protein